MVYIMKQHLILLFLLGTLLLAATLPAQAAWTQKIGDLTFFCQADNGDAVCKPSRKHPLYENLSFLITRQQSSDLNPQEVKKVFEDVFGTNWDIIDSDLAACGKKHDPFRIYKLTAKEKGTNETVDVLVRITLTSFYWMMYFHTPEKPAADTIFTPKMLNAFCKQIF